MIKLTNQQIQTLRNLPNNLNDKICSKTLCGLFILTKTSEFKQIIIDFQSYSMEEFYTKKNDNRVHLLQHIRNPDMRNLSTFTFEIVNINNTKELDNIYSSYSVPGIYQLIKCTLHSIYRNVFNHMVFTPSGKNYVISMKKTYYYQLLHQKHKDKLKMKDLFHLLMTTYLDMYHKSNNIFSIPDDFNNYFNIKQFNNNGLLYEYISYNINYAKSSILS